MMFSNTDEEAMKLIAYTQEETLLHKSAEQRDRQLAQQKNTQTLGTTKAHRDKIIKITIVGNPHVLIACYAPIKTDLL